MPAAGGATCGSAKAPAGTQAVQRASQIMKQIGRSGARGACVSELSRDLGIERPTLHRILVCLLSEGLVGRNPRTKRYHPGRVMYELGQVAAPRYGLREICAPSLARIVEQTGNTVFLASLDGTDGLVIDRRDSATGSRRMPLQIGMRRPLGVGATGLAMLMTLDDAEIGCFLTNNAWRLRQHNVRPGRLPTSLRKFRDRGYAASRGYGSPELYGIGVPLLGPDGRPRGAISVTALFLHITPQSRQSIVAALREECTQINLQLRAA